MNRTVQAVRAVATTLSARPSSSRANALRSEARHASRFAFPPPLPASLTGICDGAPPAVRGVLGRFWRFAGYREARRVERIGAEIDLVAVVVPITVAVRSGWVGADGGFVGVGKAVGVAVLA
jgi:hypothetical protein